MNRITQVILAVVVIIVVAVGSFYGGMVYGQGQATSTSRFAGAQGRNGPGGYFQSQGQGRGQGGGVFGQVTQVGDGFVVVTDNNGKETRVQVTDTTLIEKNASVKLTDLATGDTVMVSGSQASDGTYTARAIQVAPAGRFGGPGNGQNPNGANPGGTNQ